MKITVRTCTLVLAVSTLCGTQAMGAEPVPVTVDNFVRAESDLYFGGIIKDFGFGKLGFRGEMAPKVQNVLICYPCDTPKRKNITISLLTN